jgi:hypothetical protein
MSSVSASKNEVLPSTRVAGSLFWAFFQGHWWEVVPGAVLAPGRWAKYQLITTSMGFFTSTFAQ